MELEKQSLERFELLNIRLYNAALEGNVSSLDKLVQLDPQILDRCRIEKSGRFAQTPLHVAADLGHIGFVMKILEIKPRLAEELDHRQQSPLHLSASNGHLGIVNVLLDKNPNMCLARDQDGRNPLHIAAMKGKCRVLEVLYLEKPQAAYERTNTSESVLHMCVKYNQLDALKLLIKLMNNDELLNATDSADNTILHLAVEAKQCEMVKFLAGIKKIDKKAINDNNLTAVDMISEKDGPQWMTVLHYLKSAGALSAKAAKKKKLRDPKHWSNKHHDALMVVASLIATLAFQVGINPPGGTWQDFENQNKPVANSNNIIYGIPGTSIYSDIYPGAYNYMQISNGVALVSSLSVILLLLTRFRYNKYFPTILIVFMWIALTATTYTYLIAAFFVSNRAFRVNAYMYQWILHDTWKWVAAVLALFLICILLDHAILVIGKVLRSVAKQTATVIGTII